MRSSRRTRNENHQVSDFAKKVVVDGSLIRVQEKQSAFHPRAQQNAFRRRDARPQSRLFAPQNPRLTRSPQLQPALLRLSALISQYFMRMGEFFTALFSSLRLDHRQVFN
jgi:hypothetical protein